MSSAVSLFTSGGIGDLAVSAAGFDVVVSNELLADRHAVFAHNFPDAVALTGDLRLLAERVVDATLCRTAGRAPDLLYATPPCQGMSRNGRGKLLAEIRGGRKPPLDERNRLVLPTMDVAARLRPQTVLLENVPEMADTLIVDDRGEVAPILDHVRRRLGPEYVGHAEVVEFADYGVPQCRQRLISIFSRLPALVAAFRRDGSFLPPPTHSRTGADGRRRWRTVRDTIGDLPPLDAGSPASASSAALPYHRVPLLDAQKHWWVRHTPPERSAFDNQCAACGAEDNAVHAAGRDGSGVNRASRDTPVHCARCGSLLPRPSVADRGGRRLMRGFTSAYKRMAYDRPASALTRNLSYACSDNKLHPEQHRVLSLHEAFRLHTIDQFDYEWCRADGRRLSDKTIREIIGESIPPAGFLPIVRHLADLATGAETQRPWAGPLFQFSRSG